MTKKLFGKILAIGLLAATQASFAQEVKTQVEPIAVEGQVQNKVGKKNLSERHHKMQKRQEMMWKKTDANGDGKISRRYKSGISCSIYLLYWR